MPEETAARADRARITSPAARGKASTTRSSGGCTASPASSIWRVEYHWLARASTRRQVCGNSSSISPTPTALRLPATRNQRTASIRMASSEVRASTLNRPASAATSSLPSRMAEAKAPRPISTAPNQRAPPAAGATCRGSSSDLSAWRVDTHWFISWMKGSVALARSSRPMPSARPSRLPTKRNTTTEVTSSCVTIDPPDMLLFSPASGSGEVYLSAFEPGPPLAVKPLDFGSPELGQAGLDGEPQAGLQVGEVAVAFGKAREQRRIELQARRRVDRVHAVLLVDRLAAHDRPAAALLEEVVEAPGAHHVHRHAVDLAALADGHLGLRDGARA